MIKQSKICKLFLNKLEDLGRLRKTRPMDCGNTKCYTCHSDKYGKEKSRELLKEDLNYKEQMQLQNNK